MYNARTLPNPTLRAVVHALVSAGALALLTAASGCGGGSDGGGGGSCTPGTTTGCPSGQICSATGICEPTGTVNGTLVLEAPGARACEVLLESSGSARVVGATFATGVHGAFRERQPRTAVAVSQSANAAFSADAITLQLQGGAAGVAVRQVNCFDAAGAALSGATASIR